MRILPAPAVPASLSNVPQPSSSMPARPWTPRAVLGLLFLLAAAALPCAEIRGEPSLRLELEGLASTGGPLLPLEELARGLGLRTVPLGDNAVEVRGSRPASLVCRAGRRAVVAGDRVVLLDRPVERARDRIWVPLEFVERALGALLGRPLEAAFDRGTLTLRDGLPHAIPRWHPRERGVEFAVPLLPSSRLAAPPRRQGRDLVVALPWRLGDPGTPIPPPVAALAIENSVEGAFLRLRPAPGWDAVPMHGTPHFRVALVQKEDIQGPESGPPRDLQPRPLGDPDVLPVPPAEEDGGTASSEGVEASRLRLVVLDPGHGGVESGAVGPRGLQEKTVVLQVARRLRPLLEERGLEVALTREEDVEMPLDERTSLANQMRADLFVSLHANAATVAGAHGSETFFLSREATDEMSRKIAAIESNTLGLRDGRGAGPRGRMRRTPGALEMTLWEMAQSQYLQESKDLAEEIQSRLNEVAGTPDRGVKQGPLTVLMGATMPAVLVELGFVTNPAEEAQLRDPAHQQKLAQALAEAIADFADQRRRRAAGENQP